MSNLKEGDKAPEFAFTNLRGETKALSNYKGKKVILYFYPKDNTPGCTAEACNLRDNYEILQQKGYEVIGVSPDSNKSHKNFTDKFGLQFELAADTDKIIATKYDVWGEKQMYGKTYMGINRTTFIISEDGDIEKIIDKVNTKEHFEQIIEIMEGSK